MRYVHTNLVARDWRALADFYVPVFGCELLLPERDLRGAWLEDSAGLAAGARLRGAHLRLPGPPEADPQTWPTLELFQYDDPVEQTDPVADRLGFGHLAFRVEDVPGTLAALLRAGGGELGRVAHTTIPGVGELTVVYARDPEGNILELQSWA
ncbi:VOC family protein [Paraconexibacter algicola]|uniref:Glyoxalase n=1 Tax=Paraconexibacter algicola TaxID=2133960 RepID=A0A2T4UI01_9ACTN|nr:VOC family protein [Paraconexibacter algicola]PTL58872.1 glyoxalase [Paraconexibacter algicola]